MSEIKYRLAVDPSQLSAQLAGVERQFSAMSGNAGRSLSSLSAAGGRVGDALVLSTERAAQSVERLTGAMARVGHYTAAIGASMPIASLARGLAGMADEVASMEGRLKLATGSSREFAQAQADIAGIAERQRAGLTEVGALYTKTASVAADLGASQADVAKFTEAVAASLVLNGTSAQASAGALLQLGQAIGGTNLQAEEFNSILDGARPLLAAAAKHIDGTGGSLSKLKELVGEGKVSSKEFFQAVLLASEELKSSTAQLPLTIGQATTLMRNDALKLVGDFDKVTGGSQQVAEAIRGLGNHLDVLAVAGVGLAGVMGGRLLQSLLGTINASIVKNAAAVQELRTTVAQTEAAVAQATAQTAAARAMNLGVGSATALATAEARLQQAQMARAAAQSALTAATSAGGAAAGLAGGAVALMGGPLGIALGLLSAGAAAWALWKSNATDSAAAVEESVMGSGKRITDQLTKEIELLERRLDLQGKGVSRPRQGSDEQLTQLQKYSDLIRTLGEEIQGLQRRRADTFFKEQELRAATQAYAELVGKMERAGKLREEQANSEQGDKRTKWLAQMGDKAVQLQQELKKARDDFGGVIPKDIEAAIRKKFSDPVSKAADDMVKAGAKLYGDLTAQGGGLAGDFAEKWDSLSAAYKANKVSVEQLQQAQRILLEQQPGIKANMEEEARAAKALDDERAKAFEARVKAADQDARQALERLAALQLEEAGLALSARSNITLAEAIERVQIARLLEAQAEALSYGEEDRAAAIEREIKARQKLAGLAGAKELREQGKEAGEALKQYLGKDIGANLAAGFDKASQSLGSFVNGVRELADAQQAQADAHAANLKANSNDLAKFAKVQQQITDKATVQQLNAYGNITGAAKGFFKEGTKGYKALETAEKVFRAFELAMSLKSVAQKVFEVSTKTAAEVAGQGAVTGAVTAGEGARNLAKVPGVFMSFMSALGPWGAAAAAAAIAAVLGGSFGGGGSTVDPGNTGTGTVLGDSSAQSESIGKSIDRLAENSDVSLRYSQGMLAALNTIASGISGLSGLIVRDESLTTGSGFNIETGTQAAGYTKGLTNPLLATVLGGPVGLAASLLTKIPVVGKLVGSLFGTKTTINGTGLYMGDQTLGSIMDGGANLQNYADITKKKKAFGISYSSKSSTQYEAADSLLAQQFSLMFDQFAQSVELAAMPLGANLDEVRNRLATFVVSIGKINLQGLTGEEIQEKLTAVFGAAADSIAGAALPGLQDFQQVGEGYFETVVRVASGIESAGAVLDRLGIAAVAYTSIADKQGDVDAELIRESLLAWEHARYGLTTGVGEIVESFSGSADELATLWESLASMRDGLKAIGVDVRALGVDMIRGAGSVDALNDGLQAYFDNFLTEAERTAELSRRMAEQFAALGLAMPSSSDGFKQLVQGIDISTAAGQALFGKVITLSSGFAELQEALAGTAETSNDLTEQRLSLENQLLQLQGNTAELRRRELADLDESLRPLQERIWALQDEQSAAQAATQALQQLTSQRESLEGQLLQLQGNTAEIRARELAKLDESLRPLQERIYALQDEQAAVQAANQLASQRQSLEEQLLQLQGNTAEVRARELANLDESLRPLQERIYALQDEQAAAQSAADAATQASEAWGQLGDSISDEIKRIKGLLTDSPESGLSSLQAQFAIDTAAARAGDQEAAGRLPQLSSSLLTAAEASASSSTELRRIQAATMASLEATLAQVQALQALQVGSSSSGSGSSLSYDAAAITGGSSEDSSPTSELLQELRNLRAEVAQLRSEQEASQFAIASNTQRTAKVLERVSPDGDALATREAS